MNISRKYFQTMLVKEVPNKIYCNALLIFYKGEGIAELYIDDIDPNVINMSSATRKKWAFENYSFLIDDMLPEVLDDESFPPKVLSRKDLFNKCMLD